MEHLRARELALAHLVEAQHWCIKALAGRLNRALAVQHDDLRVICGDRAGAHASLGQGGLERPPGAQPGLAALEELTEMLCAPNTAPVGQRRRILELHV